MHKGGREGGGREVGVGGRSRGQGRQVGKASGCRLASWPSLQVGADGAAMAAMLPQRARSPEQLCCAAARTSWVQCRVAGILAGARNGGCRRRASSRGPVGAHSRPRLVLASRPAAAQCGWQHQKRQQACCCTRGAGPAQCGCWRQCADGVRHRRPDGPRHATRPLLLCRQGGAYSVPLMSAAHCRLFGGRQGRVGRAVTSYAACTSPNGLDQPALRQPTHLWELRQGLQSATGGCNGRGGLSGMEEALQCRPL